METQSCGDEHVGGAEVTLGPSITKGMNEFRRQIVLIDLTNALWRVGTNAKRVPKAAHMIASRSSRITRLAVSLRHVVRSGRAP
jgi:hypothetical protein